MVFVITVTSKGTTKIHCLAIFCLTLFVNILFKLKIMVVEYFGIVPQAY